MTSRWQRWWSGPAIPPDLRASLRSDERTPVLSPAARHRLDQRIRTRAMSPARPRARGAVLAGACAVPVIVAVAIAAHLHRAPAPAAVVGTADRVANNDAYARELTLLAPARGHLAAQRWSAALAAAEAHERQFPQGALAEERDAVRILALVGAHRFDSARPLLSDFVARHPNSPLRASVERAWSSRR